MKTSWIIIICCCCCCFATVPVIGFEQTQFTVVENDTVGTEVCVSVMAPPTLGGTVTVMLVSMDGTARGK